MMMFESAWHSFYGVGVLVSLGITVLLWWSSRRVSHLVIKECLKVFTWIATGQTYLFLFLWYCSWPEGSVRPGFDIANLL